MRVLLSAGALATVLWTGTATRAPAAADEAGSRGPLTLPMEGGATEPDWLIKPSAEEVVREYPPLARLMGLDGVARITCVAETDGRADACHVVSESPPGLGFGAAAMRIAAYFKMKPGTRNGVAVPATVNVPIHFKQTDMLTTAIAAAPPLAPTSPGALDAARQVVALEDTAGRLRTQWRTTLDQMSAELVLENHAQAGEVALDAFRAGLEETISDQVDRYSRLLAARMNEIDLRAAAAFLQSPAGKAWVTADIGADQTAHRDFMVRLAAAARAHLCAKTGCAAGPDPRSPGAVN